jgi:endonuclease G
MPIISAVNVEGNPDLRLDNSKRKDDWLRDHRIDLDIQLKDRFYASSGFDKGHMSRFEDANWDKTEATALRNGIFTCFHTNACPQVPDLNRKAGIWVKLEKAILENGIKKEEGKLARVTVFNGPIFSDKQEKEKVFKGVAIPFDFFKIVLWTNDDGDLKATGFKLSQKKLLKDIDWNAPMDEAEEALDLDQNEVFENYQCSIKSLAALTKIDFSHLYKYDTFEAGAGEEEALRIDSEESLKRHIKKHSKQKRK